MTYCSACGGCGTLGMLPSGLVGCHAAQPAHCAAFQGCSKLTSRVVQAEVTLGSVGVKASVTAKAAASRPGVAASRLCRAAMMARFQALQKLVVDGRSDSSASLAGAGPCAPQVEQASACLSGMQHAASRAVDGIQRLSDSGPVCEATPTSQHAVAYGTDTDAEQAGDPSALDLCCMPSDLQSLASCTGLPGRTVVAYNAAKAVTQHAQAWQQVLQPPSALQLWIRKPGDCQVSAEMLQEAQICLPWPAA